MFDWIVNTALKSRQCQVLYRNVETSQSKRWKIDDGLNKTWIK